MRAILLIIVIFICSNTNLTAQNCDTLLGYSKKDANQIYVVHNLLGKVFNNPSDTMHGIILKTMLNRTPISKGIMIIFYCIRCGKLMDESVKIKIEFTDGATIILSRSQYDTDDQAEIGMMSFLMGGDYGNNYELTLLRTKTIGKISISGNKLDSNTYIPDFSNSLDYMFAIQCLSDLLK